MASRTASGVSFSRLSAINVVLISILLFSTLVSRSRSAATQPATTLAARHQCLLRPGLTYPDQNSCHPPRFSALLVPPVPEMGSRRSPQTLLHTGLPTNPLRKEKRLCRHPQQ